MTTKRIRPRAPWPNLDVVLCALVLASGCTGKIGDSASPSGGSTGTGNTTTNTGTSTGGSTGGSSTSGTGGGAVDPGRVGIHRLNNTEYNNTVRDLLGTASKPAAKFLAEEGSFDNIASALGMTVAQYEGYFKAAGDVMVESLATAAQRARFMTCTPAAAADPCARQIIETFGKKIHRRQLQVAEVDRAMKVYDADFARAKDGGEAIGQALRAMLASASFLYRVEHDPDPNSTTPHPLSGYEMASRLSYLHWSSMPDTTLLDAAEGGRLLEPATLEANVDRLLGDPKSAAFVESFAGQWLDLRNLLTHSITSQLFPTYTIALSDAMIAEGQMWFQEFLGKDRPITEWFTADFNYVNNVLATHYGFSASGRSDQLAKVEVGTDQRVGFLGLSSFLTLTSFPSRTSPTLRGVWVLSELLCDAPPPPPAVVPDLKESAAADMNQVSGSENVRKRLELHRSNPACSSCHQVLDPIGLGLERFDAIGRYRQTYGNGDPIAPEGTLPDGTPFSGPQELGALVGKDPRFSACTATKMFTYALGREVEPYDAPAMQNLNAKWAARGLTLKNLIKEVVLSDAFRFRRGEP